MTLKKALAYALVVRRRPLIYLGIAAACLLLTSAYAAQTEAGRDGFHGPSRPEEVWPTSWVGWLTAATLAVGLLTRAAGLHRWGQKGLYDGIAGLKESVGRVETHFDQEIAGVRLEVDRQNKEMRENLERLLNAFSGSVKERLDGFGRRQEEQDRDIDDVRDMFASMNTVLTGLATELARSVEDRRHINTAVLRIEGAANADRENRAAFERAVYQMLGEINRKTPNR